MLIRVDGVFGYFRISDVGYFSILEVLYEGKCDNELDFGC